jgi:peroxiredoxin
LPSTPSSPTDAPPRRRWLLAVGALAVVLVVAGLTTFVLLDDDSDPSSARPIPDGATCAVRVEPAATEDEAPVFQVPGLDGGCIDLADFRGRPVLLNFWASYCTPCRDEFPLLEQAQEQHRDDDLAVIGVSFRDIDDDARAFADEQGASWLLGFDDTGDVGEAYGVRPIPQTFFINRDGTISSHLFQAFHTQNELDKELRPILRASGGATADG